MPRKTKRIRKSPPEPAKDFIGLRRMGNDRKFWVSKPAGKSYRWFPVPSTTRRPHPKSIRVGRTHKLRTLGNIFTVTSINPDNQNIPFDFSTCHIDNPKDITVHFNESKDGGSLNVIVPGGHKGLSPGSTYIRFRNYPDNTYTLKIAEVLKCITRDEFLRRHLQRFLEVNKHHLEIIQRNNEQLEKIILTELPKEHPQLNCRIP